MVTCNLNLSQGLQIKDVKWQDQYAPRDKVHTVHNKPSLAKRERENNNNKETNSLITTRKTRLNLWETFQQYGRQVQSLLPVVTEKKLDTSLTFASRK